MPLPTQAGIGLSRAAISGIVALSVAILGSLLMAAWLSPVAILNALASHGGYRLSRDVAYGPQSRLRLDVYGPASAARPAPVVVFLYGGGWEDGDKETYLFVGAALARRGFVTVIPDYRLYPQVRFPSFVEDAALAVRWAKDHAAAFGGDASRLVLVGHSAGAHIAAMLTFDHRFLSEVGLDAGRDLRGMAGLAGPYDFLPLHSRTLKIIFGPPEHLAATQPINFVDGTAPPVFLATGRADDTVDPGNTARLAARIRQKGGEVTVRIYPRAGHRLIIGAFATPLRPFAPVLQDVARFIVTVCSEAGGGAPKGPEGPA